MHQASPATGFTELCDLVNVLCSSAVGAMVQLATGIGLALGQGIAGFVVRALPLSPAWLRLSCLVALRSWLPCAQRLFRSQAGTPSCPCRVRLLGGAGPLSSSPSLQCCLHVSWM